MRSVNEARFPSYLADLGSPRDRRLAGIAAARGAPGRGPRIVPTLGRNTNGSSSAWNVAPCTFRSDYCLMATAYRYGNRRERAERPIFRCRWRTLREPSTSSAAIRGGRTKLDPAGPGPTRLPYLRGA
jgi:hypothetical protein